MGAGLPSFLLLAALQCLEGGCMLCSALQCSNAAPAAQVGRLAGLFPLYLFTPWVEDSLQASRVAGRQLSMPLGPTVGCLPFFSWLDMRPAYNMHTAQPKLHRAQLSLIPSLSFCAGRQPGVPALLQPEPARAGAAPCHPRPLARRVPFREQRDGQGLPQLCWSRWAIAPGCAAGWRPDVGSVACTCDSVPGMQSAWPIYTTPAMQPSMWSRASAACCTRPSATW